MDMGKFRIKIRKIDAPIYAGTQTATMKAFMWEVFSVNGEPLTLPIELGEWLTAHEMEMAFLIVEPL